MILKESYKKIFTFFLLFLFLISTSGVVLFYHFCSHAHETIYSFYIDDTEELCAESAITHDDVIPHDDHCCNEEFDLHDHSYNKCCDNHQSFHKTVKLDSNYTFSKQLKSPKPMELSLLFETYTLLLEINIQDHFKKPFFENTPPESPSCLLSGKDIVTNFKTLKLDC